MEEEIKSVETTTIPEIPVHPPKKNNLLKIILLAILGFIIVAGAVYAGIKIGKKQSLPKGMVEPTLTPQVTEISPTPDETANWKTYRNEKYGFEIKYYPELTSNEHNGGSETVGQFAYLQSILFGTGLTGGNYIKSPYGFEVKIKDKSSLEDFRTEIVGHVADKIDSEAEVVINNNTWGKFNYKIFLTTDYVPITSAIINYGKYSYEVTASALDIDQILSTFRFLD